MVSDRLVGLVVGTAITGLCEQYDLPDGSKLQRMHNGIHWRIFRGSFKNITERAALNDYIRRIEVAVREIATVIPKDREPLNVPAVLDLIEITWLRERADS